MMFFVEVNFFPLLLFPLTKNTRYLALLILNIAKLLVKIVSDQ